jgi:hypothetical protein
MTLCPVKPAVYITSPEEMRKARLNQPRVTSEQFRAQLERFRRASDSPRTPNARAPGVGPRKLPRNRAVSLFHHRRARR